MELQLNKPLEVTKEQHGIFKKLFAGLIAHRQENGKYYVKPLAFMGQKESMNKVLKLTS